MTRREQLYPEIKRLREDEGMLWREISERLGLALATVHEYYSDPTGANARARKAKTNGRCLDCGTETRSDGSRVPERCVPCTLKLQHRDGRRWVLESIREWHRIFGVPPAPHDWNFAMCRELSKREDDTYARALARYLSTGRPWPAQPTVYRYFDSWPAAVRAAGFEPLKPNERWIGYRGVSVRRTDGIAA